MFYRIKRLIRYFIKYREHLPVILLHTADYRLIKVFRKTRLKILLLIDRKAHRCLTRSKVRKELAESRI
jgi:hypothetical protein